MISNRRIFLQHNTSPYLDALPPWGFPCPRFYPCWSGFQGSGGVWMSFPIPVQRERVSQLHQSLSMSLYFLRSIDTWSLNRTGSSLICEWTRGMVPNQLANLFMHVCRWAKWSGSAQRDARDVCGGKRELVSCYIHLIFNIRADVVVCNFNAQDIWCHLLQIIVAAHTCYYTDWLKHSILLYKSYYIYICN